MRASIHRRARTSTVAKPGCRFGCAFVRTTHRLGLAGISRRSVALAYRVGMGLVAVISAIGVGCALLCLLAAKLEWLPPNLLEVMHTTLSGLEIYWEVSMILLSVWMFACVSAGLFFFGKRLDDPHGYTQVLFGARILRVGVVSLVGFLAVWSIVVSSDFCIGAIALGLTKIVKGVPQSNFEFLAIFVAKQLPSLVHLGTFTLFSIALIAPLVQAFRFIETGFAMARGHQGVHRHVSGAASARIPKSEPASCDILLFSDLHITEPGKNTLEEPQSDAKMTAFVERTVAALRPKAIVLAGDITDTGHPSAWARAVSLFSRMGVSVYAAPGNHDFHFGRLNTELPSRFDIVRSMFSLNPDETFANSYSEQEIRQHFDQLCPKGKRSKGFDFPVLYEDQTAQVDILVFNSNRFGTGSPATNAVGEIGSAQLAAAARLLKRRKKKRGHPLLFVLHHHIFSAASGSLKGDLTAPFLICVDAHKILALAEQHKAAAIIHGHKHMPYVREYRGARSTVQIISCGSALYSAAGPCRDEVRGPSCFGLTVGAGQLTHVQVHADES